MDHPAALHRLNVGVPATVEHSSEATEGGSDMAKWVAETTSVCHVTSYPGPGCLTLTSLVVHHVYGCFEIEPKGQRSITPILDGFDEWLLAV